MIATEHSDHVRYPTNSASIFGAMETSTASPFHRFPLEIQLKVLEYALHVPVVSRWEMRGRKYLRSQCELADGSIESRSCGKSNVLILSKYFFNNLAPEYYKSKVFVADHLFLFINGFLKRSTSACLSNTKSIRFEISLHRVLANHALRGIQTIGDGALSLVNICSMIPILSNLQIIHFAFRLRYSHRLMFPSTCSRSSFRPGGRTFDPTSSEARPWWTSNKASLEKGDTAVARRLHAEVGNEWAVECFFTMFFWWDVVSGDISANMWQDFCEKVIERRQRVVITENGRIPAGPTIVARDKYHVVLTRRARV
jgi:hypothetical protein